MKARLSQLQKVSNPNLWVKQENKTIINLVNQTVFKTELRSVIYNVEEDMTEERTVAVSNVTFYGELQYLDERIKSMMIIGENMTPDGKQNVAACQVCGKEGYRTQIRDHIEANHVDGVVVPSNLCENTLRSQNALRKHKYCNH